MQEKWFRGMSVNLKIFVAISLLLGLASGLGDGVLSNYFNEAYHVTAEQRGFIEFPRELPGALLVVVAALGSLLGNYRLAVVAQLIAAAGMALVGFFHPAFGVMCIFISINSLGTHLYMPLQETIALDQVGSTSRNVGTWLGRFTGMRTATAMLAGLIVFLGFRYLGLNYQTPVEVFLITSVCHLCAAMLFIVMLKKGADPNLTAPRVRFVFRKRYGLYYFLSILNGTHKQIYMVFGAWVLIELFQQKTDIMAILGVVGSAIGIAFVPALGKLVDKLGVKRMMYIESVSFLLIYIGYAVSKTLFPYNIALALCVLFFLVNRMTMQFSVVRTVYIRNIAITKEDIMPTLSMGISLDHVFTILMAAVCGFLWDAIGYQWVFISAAVISIFNIVIAFAIRPEDAFARVEPAEGTSEAPPRTPSGV